MTVPSCKKHNEDFHQLDERFRFYLQCIQSNDVALDAFKDKTFRGLSRPSHQGLVRSLGSKSHRVTVGGMQTFAMEVDPRQQSLYFEKIIRGIYFNLFEKRAEGRVGSVSKDFIDPQLDYRALMSHVLSIVNNPTAIIGEATNPRVFQFKYALVQAEKNEEFVIVLRFYEAIEVYGFVASNEVPVDAQII